jgi:hypothetical protein
MTGDAIRRLGNAMQKASAVAKLAQREIERVRETDSQNFGMFAFGVGALAESGWRTERYRQADRTKWPEIVLGVSR